MPFNRAAFYAAARTAPFGGRLTQQNVDGCNAILDEWDANWAARQPVAALAYVLATVFHETAGTMRWDIEEIGKGRGRPYGRAAGPFGQVYYGRGPEQLTWLANYERMQALVVAKRFPGKDIVRRPAQALEKDIAIAILFEGSFAGASGRGDFTGKSLDQFFPAGSDDFSAADLRQRAVSARAVINGSDRAVQIATVFESFLVALREARTIVPVAQERGDLTTAAAAPVVDAGSPTLAGSKVVQGGALATVGGLAAALAPLTGAIQSPWAFGTIALVIVLGFAWLMWGRRRIAYQAGV